VFSGFVQLVDGEEGDIPFTIGKPCTPAPPMTRTAFWLGNFFFNSFLFESAIDSKDNSKEEENLWVL
jgi:hypothetical protein